MAYEYPVTPAHPLSDGASHRIVPSFVHVLFAGDEGVGTFGALTSYRNVHTLDHAEQYPFASRLRTIHVQLPEPNPDAS